MNRQSRTPDTLGSSLLGQVGLQRLHAFLSRVSATLELISSIAYRPYHIIYRYGLSTGSPSELGLRIDAQTALDYVRSHEVLGKTKIIVYGQSIGGCVGIDVAGRSNGKASFSADFVSDWELIEIHSNRSTPSSLKTPPFPSVP